jgi:hypothetical protein
MDERIGALDADMPEVELVSDRSEGERRKREGAELRVGRLVARL